MNVHRLILSVLVRAPAHKLKNPKLGMRARHKQLCVAIVVVLMVIFCGSGVNAYGHDAFHTSSQSCSSLFSWPIHGEVTVMRAYKAPEKPWLSGHRGVDIAAHARDILYAPTDGYITFAGKVAGKDVVSITDIRGWKSTFEPAVTGMKIGTSVHRGEPFGYVSSGKSDHCTGQCVQWGIKVGKKEYVDPEKLVRRARVILKD